jgi:hypothetical protein
MTTATVTESFYADRLRRSYTNDNKIGVPQYRWWFGGTRFATMQELTSLGAEFHDETYLGFQLVIVEHKYEYRELFDSNGSPFNTTSSQFDKTLIASIGEMQRRSDFYAYAYKIGDPSDQFQDLAYTEQYALIQGIGRSHSLVKTRKTAIDKLKILAQVQAVKGALISICDETMYGSTNRDNPYNIKVGDHVFVHAHGRLRKGIVTSTTGSRFVVGYVTPSNHEDLKYKIVHLGQTYVRTHP